MQSAFVVTGVTTLITKITEAGKAAIELGDNLNNARIKAGLSGRDMSELAYAAKLADVNIESLSTALKKQQILVANARQGNKEAVQTLRDLGLSVEDLAGKKPDEIFAIIAEKIHQLGDENERTRLIVEAFGRSGSDLGVLFEQGAEGIARARQEAQKLGYSFSDEQLARLADADDAIKKLGASWDAYVTSAAAAASPRLVNFLDKLRELQKGGALETGLQYAKSPLAFYSDLFSGDPVAQGPQSGSITRNVGTSPEVARLIKSLQDAGEAAKKAAKKAAADSAKEYEQLNDRFLAGYEEMTGAQVALNQEGYDDYVATEVKKVEVAEEMAEERRKTEEAVALYQQDKAQQVANFTRDIFLTAYDNWIHGAKFKFDEFLKYLVAQWTRSQIFKMFENVDSSSGWGKFLGAVGSFFGAGDSATPMAAGGSYSAGNTHIVGERGIELFRSPSSGTIVPNHKLGAGGGLNLTMYNDFRGADSSLIKAWPQMAKRLKDEIKADIADGMRRGRYETA